MADDFLAAPDFNSVFTAEYCLTTPQAERALNRLASNGQMLSVLPDHVDTNYLTSVIDQLDCHGHRLVLDQPAEQPNDQPVFSNEDTVRLIWSELGMRLGAHAQITRINDAERILSYEIQVKGEVYRQQRRDAFRVPVGPHDGLTAVLLLCDGSAELPATVKDVSKTGCRFGVDKAAAGKAGLTTHMRASVRLAFEHQETGFNPGFRVVWIEKVADEILDFGVAWEEPNENFIAMIENFVLHKERMLLKRRAGVEA